MKTKEALHRRKREREPGPRRRRAASTRQPAQNGGSPPVPAGPVFALAAPLQRQTAINHNEDANEENPSSASGAAQEMPAHALARHKPSQARDRRADDIVRRRGAGAPLRADLRHRLEPYFGVDFSQVRVHQGPTAARAARHLNAHAFTHQHHIWLGEGASQKDTHLLAHELTHVVQQGHAPPLAHGLSRPTVQRRPAAEGTVQRWSIWGAVRRVGGAVGGAIVSGARAVGRGIRHAAGELLEMGRSALMAIVRRVAPDFARLIERNGIRNTLRDMIRRGFRAIFGGALDAIRSRLNLSGLGERFSAAIASFQGIIGQFSADAWSAVQQAAGAVGSFMSSTFGPVIQRLRGVAATVKDLVSSIWDAFGAPVLDFLKRIGGAVWNGLVSFVRGIGRMFRAVKDALGAAWDRVKGWFGITADEGTDEGGGLWNWIKEKAAALWESIKSAARPIQGPLRVVGGILLALSPAGPALAVYAAWPHLQRAFSWVRQHWNDVNVVVTARNYLTQTLLPMLTGFLNRVISGLENAADWLIGKLDSIVQRVNSMAAAVGGGLLAPLATLFNFVAGQFRGALTWARNNVRRAASFTGRLLRRVWQFAQTLLQVLLRIAAIVLNPLGIPGLLLGTLWRLIPDRIKGPLINFIIDILRRFLRMLPPLPMLGILFPIVKAGVLGFLDRARQFATERKVRVANKMANIAAGGSVTFFLGFIKGLALGIWEAVTAPFQMIADLFELPELIRGFVEALSDQFGALVAQARELLSLIRARAADTLESILTTARDLLLNPRRLITMIQTALEAALEAVSGMGATLATRMIEIFEQPDEQLGEMLGNLAGGFLVEGIIAFFTAGSSAAVSAVSRVARLLRRLARNLRRILRMVVDLLRPVMRFVRRLVDMFRRAGSAAGRILRRIGDFLGRVMQSFRRAFSRIGRRGRGRSRTVRTRPSEHSPTRRGRHRHRSERDERRDRRRREREARRERNKQVVIRRLRRHLRNGIGRAALRAMMLYLKARYRIRTLRLRPGSGRRRQIIVRNSPTTVLNIVKVDPPGADRPEARARQPRPGQSMSGVIAQVEPPRYNRPMTPRGVLEAAGYVVSGTWFRPAQRSAARPLRQVARILRMLPGFIRQERSRSLAMRRRSSNKTAVTNRAKAEEWLRAISANRRPPSGFWHAGHLMGNQFGGQLYLTNLVPMTSTLNARYHSSYLQVENWLRREMRRIRGQNRQARVTMVAQSMGYGPAYSLQKTALVGNTTHRTRGGNLVTKARVRERSHGSGQATVRVPSFIPRTVRLRLTFHGQGVEPQDPPVPDRLQPSPGAMERDDVIMYLATSHRPDLPGGDRPEPHHNSRTTRHTSYVAYTLRQWKP